MTLSQSRDGRKLSKVIDRKVNVLKFPANRKKPLVWRMAHITKASVNNHYNI
jgi:hypothetical protein